MVMGTLVLRNSGRTSILGKVCGMSHFVIAAAMLLPALVVTLGTASVLQVVATARQKTPTGAFVEPTAPAFTPFATKERMGQSHHPLRGEARYARG